MSDTEMLQGFIIKFVSIVKDALHDLFTMFGDTGGLIITILFLTTMLVLISGTLLTIYFMAMKALQPR